MSKCQVKEKCLSARSRLAVTNAHQAERTRPGAEKDAPSRLWGDPEARTSVRRPSVPLRVMVPEPSKRRGLIVSVRLCLLYSPLDGQSTTEREGLALPTVTETVSDCPGG